MDQAVDRNVSIKILRPKTTSLVSALLNPVKIFPTDTGLPRYWKGLADLCNIDGLYGPSIQHDSDPTRKVLTLWTEKEKENSTISQFLSYLEQLDRFDIVDDITALVDDDIRIYNEKPYKIDKPNLEMDKYILTGDDVDRINAGLSLENYDAFVLFADDDIIFASELIETMEKQYNMRFCVKDRDLVAGGLEYDKIVQLIAERCNRLIVILSDAFFSSASNRFYLSFAQAYGIDSVRKVIPCMYKDCNLPPDLKCSFKLDYRRSTQIWNFWDKLRDSIRVSNPLIRSKSEKRQPPCPELDSNGFESYDQFLKPKNQVKFNSMVNLTTCDNSDTIVIDQNMSASTSANSIECNKEIQNDAKNKKEKKQKKIWKWFTKKRTAAKAAN